MSLIKTVRNRTKSQYAANRIAGRFAPSQTTHAATVAGHNLVTLDGRTVPASGVAYADIGSPVAVVNAGSAGIAAYSANGAGVAVQFAGGSGTGGTGTGMEVHDLNSVWHTGTIADSQGPQFLKLDGTRQLTGNLTVAAGITIDGIDLSAHAADPDAHHATATVGNGLGIIGQNVYMLTPGGLTVSSTNSNSGAHTHAIASSSAPGAAASILATGSAGEVTLAGELQMIGAAASAKTHYRASTPGSDSYIWQNGTEFQIDTESLTAALTIGTGGIATFANRVRAPLIDTASGNLAIMPAGDLILDPGDSSVLPGGSIQDDLGDYNRKWRTLYAAELYVETLVAQDVLATIGGRIMVAPTTTLIADVTSGATTIDVKHNNITGAFVMLQTAPGGIAQFEVMKVTAGPTTITGGYRYTVTRALDGSPANAWVSGDAVASLGSATGQGYIDLTSTATVHNHLGPTIAIYSRSGTGTWNDTKAVAAFGNLRSFAGYSSDEFGIAIANDLTLTATTGFKGFVADRTNGIRMYSVPIQLYNGATQTVQIAATGTDIWVGPSSADKRLTWDGTTLTVNGAINVTGGNAATQTYASTAASTAQTNAQSYTDSTAANKALSNVTRELVSTTLITGGNIRVGSGTKDSTLDGFHIDIGEIVGQAAGVDQVVMGTDGKIKAGAGNVWMDSAGLGFNAATGKFTAATASWWYSGQRYLAIGTQSDLGTPTAAFIETYSSISLAITANGGINLASTGTIAIAGTGGINLSSAGAVTANNNTIWHAGNDGPTSGLYAQYAASATDADTVDSYHAAALAKLTTGNTFTELNIFAKSNAIPLAVRIDTSGLNKGIYVETTGALATSTGSDTFQIYHVTNGVWAFQANDSGGYINFALNPLGGNVGIGTGSNVPAYKLEVNGTTHLWGDLTSGGAIGGTWTGMTTLGTNNTVSGHPAQSRRFGDITFLRGAINPADDSADLDLVQIVTTTHRPARAIYLIATAKAESPSTSRSVAHLIVHETGVIEFIGSTSGIGLVSFDGLFFFNT